MKAKTGSATSSTQILFADSERNADLLYKTRFFVPDPFLLLIHNGKSTILLSDLEVDRGKKQATVDEVVSLTDFAESQQKHLPANPTLEQIAAQFIKSRNVRKAAVPKEFPLSLARELEKLGVALTLPNTEGPFFSERLYKTPDEIKLLRKACKLSAIGLERAVEVLKAAKVGAHKRLYWGNAILTSERLRAEADCAILRAGGVAIGTIVAGGNQGCDPHERGSGPLKAGELIILDIFPRDAKTGYYGDMTRTVVKGKATDAQKHLYKTVLAGQKMGLSALRAGGNGVQAHEQVKQFFADQGYPTEKKNGRWVGFFHGTGHGLGLDIHEDPRYGKITQFVPGQVLTVEPGLYYPGLGGVRIEDVAVVTAKGPAQVLSRFEKELEL